MAENSIPISAPLLFQIDQVIGEGESRTAFIENVLAEHFRNLRRQAQQRCEMELINLSSPELNAEAEDVSRFQASYL